jgi:hypothetical protein
MVYRGSQLCPLQGRRVDHVVVFVSLPPPPLAWHSRLSASRLVLHLTFFDAAFFSINIHIVDMSGDDRFSTSSHAINAR